MINTKKNENIKIVCEQEQDSVRTGILSDFIVCEQEYGSVRTGIEIVCEQEYYSVRTGILPTAKALQTNKICASLILLSPFI